MTKIGSWTGDAGEMATPELHRGRYVASAAVSVADRASVLALRQAAFRSRSTVPDQDRFDPTCQHHLVKDTRTGDAVCSFRLMWLRKGTDLALSYSAQFYGLNGLAAYQYPMMEVGRFCVHPDRRDPDILRLALGAITRAADAGGVRLLFGCSSFPGTDGALFADTFAVLGAAHLGPDRWRPSTKASATIRFYPDGKGTVSDRPAALRKMPPLLRSYLAMGGWVGDHAVVDTDLNTLHVFTALEVAAIPAARLCSLRSVTA